jgi:hypothetical protein
MPDTTTASYGLVKVEVGASEDTWGAKLNDNMDKVDDLLDGTLPLNNVAISQDIVHHGNTTTGIRFTTDTITLRTANTDRLTVGSDGTVTIAEAGDLVTPLGMSHRDDPDTYLKFFTDQIRLAAGGTEQIILSPTGGVDIQAVVDMNNNNISSVNTLSVGSPNIASNSGDGAILTSGIQLQAPSSASDTLPMIRVYKGTSVNFRVETDGRTFIPWAHSNTTANAANVQIDSSGILRRSTSSIRYKTQVETAELSYSQAAVYGVRPVWYRSLSEADNPAWSWWGFIAEEVAEIDPRLVQWGADGRPDGVAYDRFVPHLCAVVEHQRDMIAALEARIAALEAK